MTTHSEDNTVWRRDRRREMVARRMALTGEQHAALSAAIVKHLLAAFQPPAVVAFCWPIKGEPDVRELLTPWLAQGVQAALPVVLAEAAPLAFRAWQPDVPLQADRYGIPTPVEGDWLVPEMILLPLNGFDADGYRLGYGGGYFDRTLAAFSPRPLAVGVGFEINRLPTIRPQLHDQRLDWIVTEAGAFQVAA
jgi:5,10-methenyltetrahydrofolate synthetase